MSQIYKLPLVLEPQPEGGYVVTCPLLPELISEGESMQSALQNANDALAALVEALKDLKKTFTSCPTSNKRKYSALGGNCSGHMKKSLTNEITLSKVTFRLPKTSEILESRKSALTSRHVHGADATKAVFQVVQIMVAYSEIRKPNMETHVTAKGQIEFRQSCAGNTGLRTAQELSLPTMEIPLL